MSINERALVGSCLLLAPEDVSCLRAVAEPEDFERRELGAIYATLLNRAERGEPTGDLALLAQEVASDLGPLNADGQPWEVTFSRAMLEVVSPGNAPWHARKIREAAIRRRAASHGAKLADCAGGMSPEEILTELAATTDQIQQAATVQRARPFEEIAPAWWADFLAAMDKPRRGVPSGLKDLDECTGGFRPDDLVLIAARTNVGKSALATQILLTALREGIPSALFSLEMGRSQVMGRLLSQATSVPHWKIRFHKCGQEDLRLLQTWIEDRRDGCPLAIYDDAHATPDIIRAECMKLRAKTGLGLVIIDYVQLMSGYRSKGDSREREVADISRRLKILARDLSVPIIALAQVNRGPAERRDKEPQLSDLRESGALEQDADLVLILHRAKKPDEKTGIASLTLHVAKHRQGAMPTIPLAFRCETVTFRQVARETSQPPQPEPVEIGDRWAD